MKIYLELVFIFILMIMFILWKMWYWFSTRRLLKKYKPENDKARKGGEPRSIRSDNTFGEEGSISNRHDESIQPKLLPTTNVIVDGKTSTSHRKNGSSIGKLLRRRN
jgi:hypothetical protein